MIAKKKKTTLWLGYEENKSNLAMSYFWDEIDNQEVWDCDENTWERENKRQSNENSWMRMRGRRQPKMNREWGWFGDLKIWSVSNKIIIIFKVGLGIYRKKKSYKSINPKEKVKLNFGLD